MIITDFSQILMANVFMDADVNSCAKNPSEQSKNMLMHFGINSLRANYVKHRQKYGKLIIACDSSSWRYQEFPHYKWKRKQMRAADTSGIDWKFVGEVNDELYSVLDQYFPFILLKTNGAEADDINGIIVRHLAEQGGETNMFGEVEAEPVILLSSDHDNFQLHKYSNVRQWSMRDRKFITPDKKPHLALLEKIVKGDSGDGIPNIKSAPDTFVTGTRQAPISQKFLQSFFDAKNPIDACENDFQRERFEMNQKLVSYDFTPPHLHDEIVIQYNQKNDRTVSKSQLMNFFISRRMNNLMSNIQDFF